MDEPLLPLAPVAPDGKPGRSAGSSSSSSVMALLRKNRLLKQREWGQLSCGICGLPPLIPFALFCEVLLPIGLVVFLWWARYKCVDSGQCVAITLEGWGGDVPPHSRSTTCNPNAKLADGTTVTCAPWSQAFDYSHTQQDTGGMFPGPPDSLDDGDGAGPFGPGRHHHHGMDGMGGGKGSANFYDVLMSATQNQQRIALSVDHADDIPKVQRLRSWIDSNWYPGGAGPCMRQSPDPEHPCAEQQYWLGFANITLDKVYLEPELDDYLDSTGYGIDADSPALALGIHFHSIPGSGGKGEPGDWSYAIRLNFTDGDVPPTSQGKVQRLQRRLDMGNAQTYMRGGFVATQLLLDRYIIGVRNDTLKTEDILRHYNYDWAQEPLKNPRAAFEAEMLAEPLKYTPNRLEVSPFPISGFNEDRFYTLIKDVVPMYFILTFLYTQKKVINEMIEEKESKVRESLRMLGTLNAALIGSWYITYSVIFAVLCGIFTIVASLKVFAYTSVSVLFVFFWTWCMSFVAFGFFVQAFFDKARTGGIVGMLGSFSQWVLFTGITSNLQPTRSVMFLLMLLPNCAFCSGVQLLAEFESSQMGVTWSTIHLDVDNTSMLMVLGMMVLDTIIFTFLGWYLDNVLPSEFGVRQPPWFCFLASFWRSSTLDGVDEYASDHESSENSQEVNRLIEPPTTSQLQAEQAGRCVKCDKLRKVFSTPAGPKTAVESLTLTMFEGEIFALLGHNGAGKTTTLHMLTGMTGPTSGTATVYGKDILKDMNQIRKSIGVCPQHDVLWLPLTVEEHLVIFAKLRGIPEADIPPAIVQLLQDVGLTEKVYTPAGELSGGQKRKLSLCLALIGNVSTVILDEPTSGMDPYSRRSTWNILQDCRQGRTMILTTHFMVTPDILVSQTPNFSFLQLV
jgi:ABC-type Na+ transport system ATPase subunit NatA